MFMPQVGFEDPITPIELILRFFLLAFRASIQDTPASFQSWGTHHALMGALAAPERKLQMGM